MTEEYYIGEIFEGLYPPQASVWCNSNNAYIDAIGGNKYEIKANPEPQAPTWGEIDKAREQYREEHIDTKTKARVRKIANGTWTEQNEADYLALDAEVTAWIEENLPYPVEEEQNE